MTATWTPQYSSSCACSARAERSASSGSRDRRSLRCVGDVHAGVGAHETVPRLGDNHTALHTHDAARFAQHKLDHARVFLIFGRPLLGALRGLDGIEADDLAFRLGHNLLRDDEKISLGDAEILLLHCLRNETQEIVAWSDLRQPRQRNDLD